MSEPSQTQPGLGAPLATSLWIAATLHRGTGAAALRALLADGCNRDGAALAQKGRLAEALAAFDAALAAQPDHVRALGNRANVLQLLGRLEEALASNDRALALDPDHLDSRYNRGLILLELGRFAEALACFEQVLAAAPSHAAARGNRGTVLHNLGRLEEAIADFRQVGALRPGDPSAWFNEGVSRLTLGDYAAAWPLYERRWETPGHVPRPGLAGRQWRGEAEIAGKTILLYAEQGLGDTLQFCRYAPLLAQRADVVLVVPSPLRRLLTTLSDQVTVLDEHDALPPYDLHCPLLSLPLAFNTTRDSIPADIPYLHADPAATVAWRSRTAALPGRAVGLVWAGQSGSTQMVARARDRRRSLALAQLAPLGGVPGVSLVSLQKGEAAGQAATPPGGLAVHDWTAALGDFADTAALVAALDLVVTVDTAVAHLAGALGKPVWILNRYDACWRWLRDRDDSPWYPTARLFRQPAPGDWASVIAQVAAALRAWAG